MRKCMFCNREHKELFGDKIKYCEHCKQEMELSAINAEVNSIIDDRKKELKQHLK